MTTDTDEYRPTIEEEAERLLGYWEQHGHDAGAVAAWAVTDMLSFLRFVLADES